MLTKILYILVFAAILLMIMMASCTSTDSSEDAARVIGWIFVVIGALSVIGFIISVTERIKKANRKRNTREHTRLWRLQESLQNNNTPNDSRIDRVDFIAIDFETANYEPTSICQIGLAIVQQGQVVKKVSRLVKPVPNRYEQRFVAIHGIDESSTRNADAFDVVWRELSRLYPLNQCNYVAHNMAFDRKVMTATLEHYRLPYPTATYHCTLTLGRQAYPGLPSYKLNVLADYLNIPLNHHEASSDAGAAAQIMLSILETKNCESVAALPSYILSSPTTNDNRIIILDHDDSNIRINPSNLPPSPQEIFVDKKVVILGTFDNYSNDGLQTLLEGYQVQSVLFDITDDADIVVYGEKISLKQFYSIEDLLQRNKDVIVWDDYQFSDVVETIRLREYDVVRTTGYLSNGIDRLHSNLRHDAREWEREGRLSEAIEAYEHTKCYDRLMIIYRKLKQYDDELRVIDSELQRLQNEHKMYGNIRENVAQMEYRKERTLLLKEKSLQNQK